MENNQLNQSYNSQLNSYLPYYHQCDQTYYNSMPKPEFQNYQYDQLNSTPASFSYSNHTSSPENNYYQYSYNNSFSPSSYNSYYYNNSQYSFDSGYQTSSFNQSPISQVTSRTKLTYPNEEVELNQLPNKRKRSDEIEVENIAEKTEESRYSTGKRPKLLKLENLESTDVELNCGVCKNVFYSAAKLLMHQFVHHKNGNSKQCPICFRKFGSYSNAMVHLRGHTQEKLYQCKQCDRSFVDVSTLKKHQRIHSGEKPYECHICKKKFSQSGNLSRHLSTHTQDEMQISAQLNTQSNVTSIENSITSQSNTYYSNEYTQDYYSQYQLPQNYQFNYYQNF